MTPELTATLDRLTTLAEKATPKSQWHDDGYRVWSDDSKTVLLFEYKHASGYCEGIVNDAAYQLMSAANPSTVLLLCATLRAQDEKIAALDTELSRLANLPMGPRDSMPVEDYQFNAGWRVGMGRALMELRKALEGGSRS